MQHTRCFSREGCVVGARLVTYEQLQEQYVCNECGGRVVHKMAWSESAGRSIDYAECAECGARDLDEPAMRLLSTGDSVLCTVQPGVDTDQDGALRAGHIALDEATQCSE